MKNKKGIMIVDMINYLQDIHKHHGDDVQIWVTHDWSEPVREANYYGQHTYAGSGKVIPKRVEVVGS